MKKNELTTPGSFAALSDFDLASAISEELAGLDEGFERIKIPAGGSTVFELPGAEGDDTEAVKEFSAVILYHHPVHTYYREKYTGGNNPPDCGSYDGVTGEGAPGGACASCPFSQFGSGESGGKACKNRRRVYVLREGEIFPLLLELPTGSLKEFSRYVKRILSQGKKSNAVVTRFALKKATNANGLIYSQAQLSQVRDLSPEEFALVFRLSDQVKAFSRRVSYTAEDAVEIDAEPGVTPLT